MMDEVLKNYKFAILAAKSEDDVFNRQARSRRAQEGRPCSEKKGSEGEGEQEAEEHNLDHPVCRSWCHRVHASTVLGNRSGAQQNSGILHIGRGDEDD